MIAVQYPGMDFDLVFLDEIKFDVLSKAREWKPCYDIISSSDFFGRLEKGNIDNLCREMFWNFNFFIFVKSNLSV